LRDLRRQTKKFDRGKSGRGRNSLGAPRGGRTGTGSARQADRESPRDSRRAEPAAWAAFVPAALSADAPRVGERTRAGLLSYTFLPHELNSASVAKVPRITYGLGTQSGTGSFARVTNMRCGWQPHWAGPALGVRSEYQLQSGCRWSAGARVALHQKTLLPWSLPFFPPAVVTRSRAGLLPAAPFSRFPGPR
jgi:hypothetical protein